MHVIPALVCGLAGFIAGTFLQVVVRRTPMRERVLGVRSHCSVCGVPVSRLGSVPLLTYGFTRGRCTTCASRLWSRWPWLEFVTAFAWAALGARFGWAWALPAYLAAFLAFIGIVVVDLRHFLIPNRIVYPALLTCGLVFVVAAAIEGRPQPLLDALVGMTAAWLFFGLVWLVSPRGIGFGDVRLSALIGLVTGWIGVGNVVVALFVGILTGAVTGVAFVLLRFLTRRDPIPYGPFLVLGAVVSIFGGEQIAEWWLG